MTTTISRPHNIEVSWGDLKKKKQFREKKTNQFISEIYSFEERAKIQAEKSPETSASSRKLS